MQLNKRIFGLCILLLFVSISSSFVFSVYAASEVTLYENDGDRILRLTITDAYYTDLDGDEVLDVVAYFTVRFYRDDYKLLIYPKLQLPSGETFNYSFDITYDSYYYYNYDYQLIFYDHALETGDYTLFIQVEAIKQRWYYYYCYDIADYTFDPPGSGAGGDPLCFLL
ncbi:MAG: hypothetical protein ACFFC7_07405 [Candidatus Hermodarchaeota archaeon]